MERAEAIEIIRKNMPSDKSLPVYEAIQTLVPELAENDDERIREEMIRYFTEMKKGGSASLPYDECINYLEKQKEQKSINLHDKIEELCSKYPINKYSMSDEELSAYRQGIHLGATKLAEYLSEQKSWEWREEERKILDSIIDDYEAAAKSFCGYDGKIGLLRAIRDGEYNLPKQEWSEEDEDMRDTIIRDLKHLGGDMVNVSPAYKEEIDWLKSLPERFNLQPKVEWSKEDEKILDSLIRLYSTEYSARAWPWSDGVITYGDVVNFLKSLRPSWKPSEEQMNALYDILHPADTVNRHALESLYEQLKHL